MQVLLKRPFFISTKTIIFTFLYTFLSSLPMAFHKALNENEDNKTPQIKINHSLNLKMLKNSKPVSQLPKPSVTNNFFHEQF